MKYAKSLAIAALCIVSLTVFGQKSLSPAFYRNQIALQGGFGKTSAPGVKFPFSGSLSAYFRRDRHALGFRRDYHSELQFFQSSTYYRFLSVYYGNAWVKKNSVLIPQIAIGSFSSNFPTDQKQVYRGFAAEIGLEGSVLKRGNGIGARVFFNWNEVQPYVGFQFLLNIGYSWTAQ